MRVSDIMSTEVVTVGIDATIEEVAKLLTEKNISGAPVVDHANRVVGMVTHKDLLYKDMEPRFPAAVELLGGFIYLQGVHKYNEELRKLAATKVEDIMTREVITVSESTEIEDVARLMIDKAINRVPVLREDKLVGIVSRADVVKYIAKIME